MLLFRRMIILKSALRGELLILCKVVFIAVIFLFFFYLFCWLFKGRQLVFIGGVVGNITYDLTGHSETKVDSEALSRPNR